MRVGLRIPQPLFRDSGALREAVAAADASLLNQLMVGDHVTFHGGQGADGLAHAAALAALTTRCEISTAIFQLPLRHPVPVARQVVDVAGLAAGGFVFGVGIGGEDPGELRACGVDPATRARRADEALPLLRALWAGESVTAHGEFYDLDEVRILPATPVSVVVGGRSEAGLRRAGRHGDGWVGIWVSPDRFAESVATVERHGAQAGRVEVPWRHALQVWCGFGASVETARTRLAERMNRLYQLPFEKFARWSPAGPPEVVAEAIAPFAAAGAADVNLIAVADDPMEAVTGAAEVARIIGAP